MKVASVGIDAGSTVWKAVAINGEGEILAHVLEPTETRIDEQTKKGLDALNKKIPFNESTPIGATGYGRKLVSSAQKNLTEISCHARGYFHKVKSQGLLIDIGGQDTKAIRIGQDGSVLDFAMNEKCAAGTGRFLEVILKRLSVPFDQVDSYASRARKAASISSTCTVFAETEVISLISEGAPLEEIILGIHTSLAKRVSALAMRLVVGEKIYLSGGVAKNPVLVRALAEVTCKKIEVLKDPQLIGALGAALSVL